MVFVPDAARSRRRKSWRCQGEQCCSWPWPGHVAWAGLGPRVDGAALVPVVVGNWRMLGEEDNTAKMVLFILQPKLDAWKNGIF